MHTFDTKELKEKARQARLKVLELIYKAQTSHIGSNFSAIDILTVLFEKLDLNTDKFILSAGWKAAALYYFLHKKGRITEEELNSFCQPGSKFIGLAEPIIPEIVFAGGSMGMGLAAGAGFAWSKKQRKQHGKIFVLESDGGIQVGINWEAAWFAKQHNLDNLVLIIDRNGFQAMNPTNGILDCSDLKKKFQGFGWHVLEINGHDFGQIDMALGLELGPYCIIADTIKGKGVSFMERQNIWHYAQIQEEDYQKALAELCQT